MKLVALGCALAACGGPETANIDGGPDAPPGCSRPPLAAPWLRSFLTTDLGQLAAAPRATNTERMTARTYLTAQLTAIGWTPMANDYPGGSNVFATLPATMGGTGKEIIVGAHFDSVSGSPGANDNASGSVVVLAIARYLVDVPCRSAPVTLVFFDQEEAGLFGSRAFAMQRVPASVAAVHTIDQVAWDSDRDHRFELESPTGALEAEWRAAAQVIGVPVTVTNTQGTDHEAFRDRGFAAIGLTEEYVGGDTSPFRHQPGDTVSTVNTDYLVLAAQLAAQVIIEEVAP